MMMSDDSVYHSSDQYIELVLTDEFASAHENEILSWDNLIFALDYEQYRNQTWYYFSRVVPAEDGRMIVCIMHDVTIEEEQRQRKEEISHETVEVADRVVEKQMRIVQEIASLLGETAAETKIALTKLKESISDE